MNDTKESKKWVKQVGVFEGGLPSSAKYPGSASSAAWEESSPAMYGVSATRCVRNTHHYIGQKQHNNSSLKFSQSINNKRARQLLEFYTC